LPDKAGQLAVALLQLADEQDAALAADDWDGFLALAERRAEVVAEIEPLLGDRQDLLPVLQQVAAKDQSHRQRILTATDRVRQEIAELRPQQVAMHAYFGGVAVADPQEARFIDRRD
jgi:hypothetical protein